jgi:hypothetical protein
MLARPPDQVGTRLVQVPGSISATRGRPAGILGGGLGIFD